MKNAQLLRRLLTIICVLAAVFFCAAAVAEPSDWNNCGADSDKANVKWMFSDGTLYIEGTGDMQNFNPNGPWGVSYGNKISSVEIGEGVTNIGARAFIGCAVKDISIPSTMKKIGTAAFQQCNTLEKIEIPDGVQTISTYAFSECGKLTEVTIPDSVTSIGTYAFYNCGALKYVTILGGVETIMPSAFSSCKSLIRVDLPKSVTLIRGSAFSSCSSLKSVVIPGSKTKIEDAAFNNCPKEMEIICACSAPYVEEFAAKKGFTCLHFPHDYINGICSKCGAEEPSHDIPPKTGDGTNPALLALLMVMSAGIMISMAAARKKN